MFLVLPIWAWLIILGIGIGVAIVKRFYVATVVQPQAQEELKRVTDEGLQGDDNETGPQWDI
jgi:hypothetical protein